jgi:hypothetical protein
MTHVIKQSKAFAPYNCRKMPLFRFYRITSTEGPEEYIGSTKSLIGHRFCNHTHKYRNKKGYCASFELFDKYGIETCSISLISEQDMEKADALREERRLIEECPLVVNMVRPFITEEERKELHTQAHLKYYAKHREEAKARTRLWHKENRERRKEYDAGRVELRRTDDYKAKRHQNYLKNKDIMSARYKEKIPCDVCGKLCGRGVMARHKKSKSCLSKKIDEFKPEVYYLIKEQQDDHLRNPESCPSHALRRESENLH